MYDTTIRYCRPILDTGRLGGRATVGARARGEAEVIPTRIRSRSLPITEAVLYSTALRRRPRGLAYNRYCIRSQTAAVLGLAAVAPVAVALV